VTTYDRREILKFGGAAAGAAALGGGGLLALTERLVGATLADGGGHGHRAGYGPVAPVAPINGGGEPWFALPHGFEYAVLTRTGAPMSDGTPTPRSHDGMAAFRLDRHRTRLVCNHEIRFLGATQEPFAVAGPGETRYDPSGLGGTTTIDFDRRRFRRDGGKVRDFVSLTGSVVNCAGGIGLGRRTWITCEEIVLNPGEPATAAPGEQMTQRHGYCFEVPVAREGPALTEPLVAMGRFSHEAVAVDPSCGVVYETEDGGSSTGSGFYRFRPVDPWNLAAGGRLEMLAVRGRPNADLRDSEGFGAPLTQGSCLDTTWVPISEPDPEAGNSTVFNEGFAGGGALFNRLEGCWYGNGSVFFTSTSGGNAKNGDVNNPDQTGRSYPEGYGQVWEYRPSDGRLTLAFESPGGSVCDSPDNIVVTPRGGLVLCEDDSSSANAGFDDRSPFNPDLVDRNRLIGISRRGEAFTLAENIRSDSELAGACFSPDGQFLFVNFFGTAEAGSGGTLAITGPWHRGGL
jgi:hypothetical protein